MQLTRSLKDKGDSEKAVYKAYIAGLESGVYESQRDMARKTGISQATINSVILRIEDEKELNLSPTSRSNLTLRDFHSTRHLKDKPGVREKLLERRAEKDVLQKELSDEEAKLIALSENLEREDLTPMEEARAFAEYVDVKISKDLAEEMEEPGYKTKEKDRTQGTLNFANFRDYVQYLQNTTNTIDIKTPGVESSSIEQASETIPGATPSEIAKICH